MQTLVTINDQMIVEVGIRKRQIVLQYGQYARKLSTNEEWRVFLQADASELETLDLSNNRLKYMDLLETLNLENLELLRLGDCQESLVCHPNTFLKARIKSLKKFWLFASHTSSLSFIGELTLSAKKLKELVLSGNRIKDMTCLKSAHLQNLHELWLDGNLIQDIDVLARMQFRCLRQLSLENNRIVNIRALNHIYTPSLTHLELSDNQIWNIRPLLKMYKNSCLKIINLQRNPIIDKLPSKIKGVWVQVASTRPWNF